ncbi:MAG: 50S ribosomal protein L16 [Candidatus Brocadiae bacterium]|nr:50S ribosomal protein L16 [Candidatus Brocadiia bacterium]
MALMPKRVKFRKNQRGNIKGNATQGNTVEFGDFGLQSIDRAWLSAKQIEASRITANHFLKHEGRIYIRVFPHKPITSIPQETRMGKGKGEPQFYVAVIKPGTVLFELGGVPREIAKQAFNRIAHKLPFRTKFVERRFGQ